MSKSKCAWSALKKSVSLLVTVPLLLFTSQASALVFDYEAGVTGYGTKQVDQAVATETLRAVSVNDTMNAYTVATGNGAISGTESLAASAGFMGETSVTFSLVSGKTFDLTAISFGEFGAQAETMTLTGSNGLTATLNLVAGTFPTNPQVFVLAGANAANMKGITSFTVTGSGSAFAWGATNKYGVGFDDITIVNIGFPGAPTGATATAGDTQATVNFTAPASNGGSAITTYTATSSPGGFTGTCAGPAACAITVSGLTNGTAYTFTVTATNVNGTSAASAASAPVTPKAPQTITFNNPGAQNFGTAPTLSATASSTLAVAFTSATTGVCTVTSGGALTFVTTGTCTINADQAGNGSFSAATTVSQSFAVNAVAPGAPTIGTATAGDTQASVTFTAPASNGGSAITGYTATSSPGNITGTCASSPCTVTGLTNGTAYTFTVTATNGVPLTSAASAASNSVTPKAAQTITFANPGAQNFGTAPTLTATATSGLTVAFTSATTGVCTVTSGGALTFVTAGTCTINADQAGNGSFSAATTVPQSFAVNAVVPGAPTIGTATAGNTQATVTFTAPASTGGSAITGYTVTSSPAGGVDSNAGTTGLSHVITGLTNGTAYTFTVTATNGAGTGAASAASNSVTPNAPQTITFANPGAQNFGTAPTLTATATSGLTVTFTSATTGVCTVTSGGALTFVTAGTCTINADQAGNASFVAAPTVTQTFAVNPVAPGAPTIGTATAGNAQASVTFTAPASTGGAAITGYTATSNPGGLTGTCASSPCTVTGLTNGTAYTFTVTATNGVIGAASAASNSVTPAALTAQTITFANPGAKSFGTAPTLTATATSGLAVAFTSATTGVCTVTTGGALTFVTAGTCTINADQAGNGSFSAAPTVTQSFAVNAVAPGAPTGATAAAGNAQATVNFTAPASNGGSAITTYTATSSPGGLTGTCAGPAACAITVSGLTNGTAYTFTVTATNGAVLTGAASAASSSVTPAASVPGAPTGATATAGNGQASVAFTAPGSNGGSAITGYTVTSNPGGLTATGAASPIIVPGLTNGTAYTFTVTATNAAGTGAASAASNSVTPLAGVPGAPTGVTAAAGNAQATVTFAAPASNGGAAITTYTATSNPGGLTGTCAGPAACAITVAGLTNGTAYTFTVTATNSAGTGVASAASAAVTPTAVPTAGAATMSYQLNTPVTLDLAPFISGAGVRVTVAPAHGTVTVAGTQVTYTPVTGYFGADTFSYVSTNGVVVSAAAAVTVSFAGTRPDPTKQASVTGVANQQAATTKRFWRTQISNFYQRLELLHRPTGMGNMGGGFASGNTPAGAASNGQFPNGSASSGYPASVGPVGMGGVAGGGLATIGGRMSQAVAPSARTAQAAVPAAADGSTGTFANLLASSLVSTVSSSSISLNMASVMGNEKPAANDGGINVWGAGSIRVGSKAQQGGGANIDYSTDGISFGADTLLDDKLTVGMGVGYGHEKATIGTDGTGNTSNGNSVAAYGSYRYSPTVFIDGLIGYGTLTLDSSRYIASVNSFAQASRGGSQLFGSLSSGYEYRDKTSLVSPYARYDFAIDRLNATTETGAGLTALNYSGQQFRTQQISLGLRGELQRETSFGYMLPRVRAEYQHHIEGNSQVTVAYADLLGSAYTMAIPTVNTNSLMLGVGSGFVLTSGLNMDFSFQWLHSSGSDISKAIYFRVSKTLGGK